MNNIINPENETVKRMSLRVPKGMIPDIEKNVSDSGYNKKQRTLWFEDILKEFFEIENYLDLVAEEYIKAGTTKTISLIVSLENFEKIKDTVKLVNEVENEDTDRSSVIRTAILQRLLKSVNYE
mgnify:CR=1 FL=1